MGAHRRKERGKQKTDNGQQTTDNGKITLESASVRPEGQAFEVGAKPWLAADSEDEVATGYQLPTLPWV